MLTRVADRVLPSSLEETTLLTALPSTETMARAWLGAIFSLKPRVKTAGV